MPASSGLLRLLLFALIDVSTAKWRNEFNLSRTQAKAVWEQFVDRNVVLHFDVDQHRDTRGTLMSVHGPPPQQQLLFALEMSTKDNQVSILARTRSGVLRRYRVRLTPPKEEDKHVRRKLLFGIQDEQLHLTENCRQLLRTKDPDLEFKSEERVTMAVGSRPQDESPYFIGRIREFSVSSEDDSQRRCANLELVLDSPVVTDEEVETTTLASTTPYHHHDAKDDSSEKNLRGDELSRRDDHARNLVRRLDERVSSLEEQMKHWRKVVQEYDKKIRTIELHQRGCQIDNRIISFGEKQQDMANCTECMCSPTGELFCHAIGCPHLTCKHPVKKHGQCCPVCEKKCHYNGRTYESGEVVWPKSCARCDCKDGEMTCRFIRTEKCPALTCTEQETPANQCCPMCVNRDFCAEHNPCDKHATCTNERYGAKCQCELGFFGNGTTCYDIDECLWDRSARDQLGGCDIGTLCVNLPGSFRCDCLPGYQKLDDKHCLDVIRI